MVLQETSYLDSPLVMSNYPAGSRLMSLGFQSKKAAFSTFCTQSYWVGLDPCRSRDGSSNQPGSRRGKKTHALAIKPAWAWRDLCYTCTRRAGSSNSLVFSCIFLSLTGKAELPLADSETPSKPFNPIDLVLVSFPMLMLFPIWFLFPISLVQASIKPSMLSPSTR